jgi:hypothetical protein
MHDVGLAKLDITKDILVALVALNDKDNNEKSK